MTLQLTTATGHVILELPGDDQLLMAAGRVALAHGQLELMFRMVVKSLSGLTVTEALDATREHKNWQLREEIKKLIAQKTKDRSLVLKAGAILGECKHLSDRRNELLHNAWSIGQDGSVLVKGAGHAWGRVASAKDLNQLAGQISKQVKKLNHARLEGFIYELCEASKVQK